MSTVNPEEYVANVAGRKERERLVPHVTDACDDDGCYCPEDVFWCRLLGDDDPCEPGKDWVAAAFGDDAWPSAAPRAKAATTQSP